MTVSAIVTLAEAKTRLKMAPANPNDDVLLQQFVDAVSDVVEYIAGPVRSTPYTEWHAGSTGEILLLRRPVLTVTSCTEYSGLVSFPLTQQSPDLGGLDAFGFFLYPEEGILERTAYGMPAWFCALPWATANTPAWLSAQMARSSSSQGRVQVVYTAGRATVPAHIKQGTLDLIQINYQQTQQGSRPQFGAQPVDNGQPGSMVLGYFVPNRVRESLAPSTQARGIR